MKKSRPQLNVDENGHQTILKDSKQIPIDLILEILLRLPAKSIARFRCVTRLWSSILQREDFTDLYFTKSSSRPHLLFTVQKHDHLFFFSTPQPHHEISSPLVATYHMKFPFRSSYYDSVIDSINGLFLIRDKQVLKGMTNPYLVSRLCNPSTGQCFVFPRPKTKKRTWIKGYFGYDPIGKQFKVLSVSTADINRTSKEHQVLTLGSEKMSWRMVECSISHDPQCPGICINGVLYYIAYETRYAMVVIVCFDFRSEKFDFIRFVHWFREAKMMNYKGKLALVILEGAHYIKGTSRSFVLWVLKDGSKHEWSKHIYELPPIWQSVVGEAYLYFVGVTSTNEMVLASKFPPDPFYVFFYSLEKKTIRRVEIRGMGGSSVGGALIDIFLDHVEDVKLMQAF